MLLSAHQLWETLALHVLCVDGVLFCAVCILELMTDLIQRFHVRGEIEWRSGSWSELGQVKLE